MDSRVGYGGALIYSSDCLLNLVQGIFLCLLPCFPPALLLSRLLLPARSALAPSGLRGSSGIRFRRSRMEDCKIKGASTLAPENLSDQAIRRAEALYTGFLERVHEQLRDGVKFTGLVSRARRRVAAPPPNPAPGTGSREGGEQP